MVKELPFPANPRDIPKQLRELSKEDQFRYISKINKVAREAIKENRYGVAQEFYAALGFYDKAIEAGEEGIRYVREHYKNQPEKLNQPGGIPYFKKMNEKYEKLNQKKTKKSTGKSLDKLLGLITIGVAFLFSIIFLTGGITGYTIMNYSVKLSNIFGSLFFIVGVVVAFFYVHKKV